MKFRVISDLHVDVNEKYPFELMDNYDHDKNVITLVAGDVSGNPEIDYKWLHENTNYKGFLVSGNHIVYNMRMKPIQDLQQEERDLFAKSDRWTYLEKDYKVFDDEKIVIFGATLWTDYEVGGPDASWNMMRARRYMNDFRLGRMRDEDGFVDELTPMWCLNEHKKTLKVLDEVCKKYPDYSIIVLTHHCPGIQSIGSRYRGSDCNGAYVSDLSNFIENHSNIKVWVCGHVHHPHEYRIGDCHVLSNPRGYVPYGENKNWDRNTMNFSVYNGIFTHYWIEK